LGFLHDDAGAAVAHGSLAEAAIGAAFARQQPKARERKFGDKRNASALRLPDIVLIVGRVSIDSKRIERRSRSGVFHQERRHTSVSDPKGWVAPAARSTVISDRLGTLPFCSRQAHKQQRE